MTSESTAVAQWQPFSIMDRLDDEAVLAEMQGEVIEEYVYSFEQDGRKVTGLSKTGVNAVTAEMAKRGEVIRELDITTQWEPDAKAILIIVKAGRFLVDKEGKEILLETTFGAKRQPLQMPIHKKDRFGRAIAGEWELTEDPFFFEKAVAKASRNAKRALLSEPLIIQIINQAVNEGGKKVKRIRSGKAPETAASAPATVPGRRSGTRTVEVPSGKKDAAITEAAPTGSDTPFESPPTEPVDISAAALSRRAKELGFETKEQVFEVLGVESLDEWREKATTGTPLREAAEVLTKAKSEDSNPADYEELDL